MYWEAAFTDAAVEVISPYPDAADATAIAVVDGLVGVVVDEHTHRAIVYTEDLLTRCALQGRCLLDLAGTTAHCSDSMSVHLVSLLEVAFLFILSIIMAEPAREEGLAATSKQLTASFVMLTSLHYYLAELYKQLRA
jgi:hypothetical protein